MAKATEAHANYSDIEHEVIALDIALNNTNASVNSELMSFEHSKLGTEIVFPSNIHEKYFYVLVSDFLSKGTDVSVTGFNGSCLDLLRQICNSPLLGNATSIKKLRKSTKAFDDWLQKTVSRKVTIQALDYTQVELELTREEIIYIAANISKHHFGHLTSVRGKLTKAIRMVYAGETLAHEHDLIKAFDEIYNHLQYILGDHGSVIAQSLNDIRLGIQIYLQPEYQRAYVRPWRGAYRYKYPKGVDSELAMACYWDLMEFVKSKPAIEKFKAHKYLTMRF